MIKRIKPIMSIIVLGLLLFVVSACEYLENIDFNITTSETSTTNSNTTTEPQTTTEPSTNTETTTLNESTTTTTETGATTTTEDITKYTVSFNLNNDEEEPATGKPNDQLVEEGGKAVEPDEPSREGYTFEGWYIDEECTESFDFDEIIFEDLTVYAGWRIIIPDGFTSSEANERLSIYLSEIFDAYFDIIDEDLDDDLASGLAFINLSLGTDLLTFAICSEYGLGGEEYDIIDALELLYENVTYEERDGKYILEYDDEDIHEVYVFEYDENTDSGKMVYYENYEQEDEVINHYFEYVKVNDGYAIQSSLGRYFFAFENDEIVSFRLALHEVEDEWNSIYKNPDINIDEFIENNASSILSYDGTNFIFEGEVLDFETFSMKKVTITFSIDGTIISKVEE